MSTGCAVLAEVGWLAVVRVRVVWRNRRVDGCQSRRSSVFYRLFLGGGVFGLRRCRSAVQLVELLVVLSRPGVEWDFFHYHCHITLNGSVVVRVHCIVVCLCGSFFLIQKRFRNLNTFVLHSQILHKSLSRVCTFTQESRTCRKERYYSCRKVCVVFRCEWLL